MTTAPPPPPPPDWSPTAGAPAGYYAPVQRTSGLAIASMVLGIVSIACGGFAFLLVPPVLAVIFGNLALNRVAESGGLVKGRGMAIAGIVLGWVGVALGTAVAIAWLVYGISNL